MVAGEDPLPGRRHGQQFRGEGEAAMEFINTFWALVPPIVAIALALITKEVHSSLFAGIVVGALANTLWNLSIKKGNMLLVVLVSNFLPIISTVMTSFMLGVGITVPIIVGSLLVVVGTLWSKQCFREF